MNNEVQKPKLKIYCVYFEGKYTPEYVERLYNGLKRNCKVDFEFICYSDTKVIADKVIPLPKPLSLLDADACFRQQLGGHLPWVGRRRCVFIFPNFFLASARKRSHRRKKGVRY